jgi:hypothetical protein
MRMMLASAQPRATHEANPLTHLRCAYLYNDHRLQFNALRSSDFVTGSPYPA